MVKHELSYDLWVTSYKLKAKKHDLKFKSASSNPRIPSSNSWVTTWTLRVASSNPRVQKSFNQWKLK